MPHTPIALIGCFTSVYVVSIYGSLKRPDLLYDRRLLRNSAQFQLIMALDWMPLLACMQSNFIRWTIGRKTR